jgi:predicted amidohydrolase
MRAACIQLQIDKCRREDNVRRALERASFALQHGAKILVFPELFQTGFCHEPSAEDRHPFHSLDLFMALAKERGCLILGSIIGGRYNLGFCLEGEEIWLRPKIHPFDFEKGHFDGGDFIAPVVTRWGSIGIEICYDLRFPEVARSLALQGADILVTVAQFPADRVAHWRTLCIARAIENQMPHIACNWAEGGGSMIIDADGDVLAEADCGETVVLAEIDLANRDVFRRTVTCFADRRPEVY